MASGTPSKRYLCQAPRPDAWDCHAEDVLRNLGGSRDKRVASIRESLARAKRRNPFTPKAGPGRKTNVEHAIAFYEHLLEKLDAKLPQEHYEIDPVKKRDESEDDEEDDEEEIEEESLQSCGTTTAKVDPVNNHLCEVCDQKGELLMCTECNLHFHKSCVRPVMTILPEAATWRCSYCILSTEPKNSKARRQAAAAVRMMARLRNRCRRVKETEKGREDELRSEEEEISQGNGYLQGYSGDENEEDSSKKSIPNESPPSSRRIRNQVQLDEANRASSRKRDVGEKSPSSLTVGTDESHGRVKRARKQPTLYDPQLCPASKWESDDVRAKKAIDKQSDTSDDDTASAKGKTESVAPARRDHEIASLRQSGQDDEDVWCNFCGDDPNIKVCCFCACRVCFGKHHQTKLLLCDRCDDEYHTFCLHPPLKSVPKKKWFCPSCADSEEKSLGRTSSRVETRGLWKSQGSNVADECNTYQRNDFDQQENQDQPRDMSGRFLSPGTTRGCSKSPKTSTPEETRKRGRPPSTNKSLGSQRKAIKDGFSRGRKPGSREDADNDGTPGRRQATYSEPSNTPCESVPITVSRSGRTVKRNSFHDEIGPGEQHLRIGRPAAEPTTSQYYATIQQNSAGQVPIEDSVPTQAAPSSDGLMEAAGTAKISFTPEAIAPSHVEELGVNREISSFSGFKECRTGEPIKAATQNVRSVPQLAVNTDASNPAEQTSASTTAEGKVPRRKPGARECMQISRRFGADVIPQKYIDILLDYCKRGKVEHLIRMRERLDDHARFLESQLAGLEARLEQKVADTVATSTNQEPAVSSEVEAESKNPNES